MHKFDPMRSGTGKVGGCVQVYLSTTSILALFRVDRLGISTPPFVISVAMGEMAGHFNPPHSITAAGSAALIVRPRERERDPPKRKREPLRRNGATSSREGWE
ncbi:hypothetical protein PRIPAC_72776 [Pristionchus pacificus]|uniref:Uncharacterized protein n=1 Tax=Pristionchus pacificus TaxID=54126 RepID=A0A2A6BZW6_PRIPA|nr:hypothetical protein PRIPAC_72776 [Pristionchus pacificus]|eukprot:PDM71311.1 hypothetical protein PRIPAC_37718 [Pristionchus pacificus]